MPATGIRGHDVAIIGCGLMGTAIARQLASSGYSVAVWNRTPSRAEVLASDRISPMRAIDEAVHSSPLVLAFTASYETTLSAFEKVDDWAGTTLINFASGTPNEAEEMQGWAADRGAKYLDGVLLSYPKEVGLPDTVAAYSGPSDIWSEHRQTLMSLGGASFHASEQVAVANVLFVGMAGFCIAALGAYAEATTYIQSHGVSAAKMRAMTVQAIDLLRDATEPAATTIENEAYETDQATIGTYADAMRSFLLAMQSSGQRARIFAATSENLDAAEAAGLGGLDFYAQAKVIGES